MPTTFTTSIIALASLWLLNFFQLCLRHDRLQEYYYYSSFPPNAIHEQFLMKRFQLRRAMMPMPMNRNSANHSIYETGGDTTTRIVEEEEEKWENPLNEIEHNMQQRGSFPREISSFADLLNNIGTNSLSIPRNIHIAFAGDSLTRYQYLSLAHFFKYGQWIDPDEVPNMTIEKQHSTWHNFYNFTKGKLAPYEECDCFRPQGHKMALMMENRYFFDPSRNNSISFFQKFGHKLSFKSNWNVSHVHNPHDLITEEDQLKFQLETQEWPYFIRNFVAKLDPKPTYFVFNEGIHPHRDFTNKKVRRQIVRALKDSGIIGVYKTTTKYRLHNITNNNITETSMIRDYELDFCKKVDLCLDLSWTWLVPIEYYSDYAHFKEPIYTWQNIQLMELLKIDKKHYKQMKQHFVGRKSQIDLSFV
jgi:hypothetical protein